MSLVTDSALFLMPLLLVFGATGYIGSAVVRKLLREVPGLEVTALIRRPEQAEQLEAVGIHTVVGSIEELDKVYSLVSKADVVLNAANSESLSFMHGILAGQRQHFNDTGIRPVLIHTSSSALVFANGEKHVSHPHMQGFSTNGIKRRQSGLLLPQTLSKLVDIEVTEAIEQNFLDAYIVSPSLVYGQSPDNRRCSSFWLQFLAISVDYNRLILPSRQSGLGKHVHIDDLASLYIIVYRNAMKGNPYKLVQSKQITASGAAVLWKEVSYTLANCLLELNVISSPDVLRCSSSQFPQLLPFSSSIMDVFTDTSNVLGWVPKEPGLVDVLSEEISRVVQILRQRFVAQ